MKKNKLVVIKIVSKRAIKKIPGGMHSIEREVAIMKRIAHKNCLKLLDSFEIVEKEKFYVVTECCRGGNLLNFWEKSGKKLPQIQIRNLFLQVLTALDYLHSQKIIHSDIKPDNMLLTLDGTLKLSDFGVAWIIDNENFVKKGNGSPAFQPPELSSNDPDVDMIPSKIDIWSFGISLYLLVVGVFPFEGKNVFELFENISKCEYTIPPNVDEDVADLLKNIIEMDVHKRYTLTQIRNHKWFSKNLEKIEFVPIDGFRSYFHETKKKSCNII